MSGNRRPRDEEHASWESRGRAAGEPDEEPDVLLDVPSLKVEELNLKAEQLRVRVSFGAELADMVKINVGLEAEVGGIELEAKGIEAEAQLKARLGNVRAIFSQVLSTLDNNPDLVHDLVGNVDPSENEPEEDPKEPPRKALEESQPEYWESPPPDDPNMRDDGARPADVGSAGEARGTEATEAARKKAEQLGIDLDGLKGTGTGGRILVKDVMKSTRG